jgi:uncharacterized protein (TIGR03437 family)
MFSRNVCARRWIAVALLVALTAPAFISKPATQTRKRNSANLKTAFARPDSGKKKGLNGADRTREAEIWHELNRRRLAETDARGLQALTADYVNQDVNDISVIQDDGRVIFPANPFDLTGRAVQFSPSGSGYKITTGNGTFDTNLGTKLNMTLSPAVNPEDGADPGDDAYILQNLGFNFSFFGASYSNVAVSSNGNLTFRPGAVTQEDFDLGAVNPSESLIGFQQGLPRIAPYWHDLDARAAQAAGASGVYVKASADNVLFTWNNIRDFPNDTTVDNGFHRFQARLFNDGRIVFTYDLIQLTSTGLVGLTPGNLTSAPSLVNLMAPPSTTFTTTIVEFFSKNLGIDTIAAAQAFYLTHPSRDVYDFVYLVTDFDFDLGDAFAFYLPLRNDANGIGQNVGEFPVVDDIGSQRIQGILNLSNIATQYPASPVTRFLGANHAFSIMGQEQGHRWLAYVSYPGNDDALLLGRDSAHWNFFLNIESNLSGPAAPRSSSAEGNVWRDNNNGTFTSVNLVDGYSRLDQYLMGLRPASDVPNTFVITNPTGTSSTRVSNPRPNVTVTGGKQTVTIDQILQANGPRNPNSTAAPKNFRAAVVLLTRQGAQPSAATLDKINLYRLGWESYFAQSTDFLASINTGLSDQTTSRVIAAASAASFSPTLAAGEIAALFGPGGGLTSGGSAAATSQPLPTTLAGVQVRINGVFAPLIFASPSQINFQVPRETATMTLSPNAVPSSTALVEVLRDGQLIRVGTFQVAPVTPAIFTFSQNGAGPAAAVDPFTGAIEPFNAKQSNGQPNIISVFGTGLGADATDVDANVNGSSQATIDGAPAQLQYAGRAPGFTGLNQFNVIFPANLAPGTHNLVISRNGIPANQVTIAVK